MTDTCSTCVYFIAGDPPPDGSHVQLGDCRRYAPRISDVSPNTFPVVQADWWCQEFGTPQLIDACAGCSAWSPVPNPIQLDLPPTPTLGECRRHAPRAYDVGKSSPTIFPLVNFDHSCGEFVNASNPIATHGEYQTTAHTVGTANVLSLSIPVPVNSVWYIYHWYVASRDDLTDAAAGWASGLYYRAAGDLVKAIVTVKNDFGSMANVTTSLLANTGTQSIEVWANSTLGGSIGVTWWFRTQTWWNGR